MPSTIHLRRKIRSVSNTKQITRAMQMVAASKMRKAQDAVLGTRAYAQSGMVMVQRLQKVLAATNVTHPLFRSRPVKTITLVVIASDRGLAGGYNANVTRKALEFLKEHQDQEVQVVTIGRKIQEALSRAGVALAASFTDISAHPTSADIIPIAKLTIDAFLAEQTDEVHVIYTRFYSTLRQVAQQEQLLPVISKPEIDEEDGLPVDYRFEPDPEQVLRYIVPRIVETQLFQLLLESIASEHSARMLAMKNATDNATELIGDLQLTYNSVRQANITQEIAEISAGATV